MEQKEMLLYLLRPQKQEGAGTSLMIYAQTSADREPSGRSSTDSWFYGPPAQSEEGETCDLQSERYVLEYLLREEVLHLTL